MRRLPEGVRAQYLAAMGIAVYVPRSVLPGAPPVRRLPAAVVARPSARPVRPVPAQPVPGREIPGQPAAQPQVPVQDRSAREGSGLAAVSQILETTLARPGERPLQVQVKGPRPEPETGAAAPSDESIRFTLNLWRVSAELLVIDSHLPRRGLPVSALLSNILRAAGQPDVLPASETLHWPLLATSSRLADARDMVSAFLASRMAAQPARRLWLLGEAGFKACTTASISFEEALGKTLPLPELGVEALVLPGLATMLESPALKVIAWKALREAYGIR